MSVVDEFADVPTQGELRPVAPGIAWVRLPIPFHIDHVNCWVLDDGPGWAVVDCGIDTEGNAATWEALANGPLAAMPIRRLIATHGHTDHVGFAGRFVDRFDTTYEVSLTEWMAARLRRDEAINGSSDALTRFLTTHGCGSELVKSYAADRARTTRYLGPQPSSILRLCDGATLMIGGRAWRVITGEGHADEHVALYCGELNVLVAGDQVLPRISPVVPVTPEQPEADPLGGFLRSLERFRGLPDDTLILPSHGVPFTGLHARLNSLAAHHAERLDRAEALLWKPMMASAVASQLFQHAVAAGQGRLALAETLAHLHHLAVLGRIARDPIEGRIVFRVSR